MHVLCEIHQEATSWILFFLFFSSVSFGQSVTDVPCQAISFLSLYLWPHSVVPFSLGDLSLLWVCYRVCLSSVCLSAGAAVQSPWSEWWKCVLFIRVREGASDGGMYCIDTIVKMICDGHKCIIKNAKNCVYYWLDNFLFSQVNTSWAVGKLVWLWFCMLIYYLLLGVNFLLMLKTTSFCYSIFLWKPL